jgi:NTP pyrophosphatase (non-canonical NTP hydrolase)
MVPFVVLQVLALVRMNMIDGNFKIKKKYDFFEVNGCENKINKLCPL